MTQNRIAELANKNETHRMNFRFVLFFASLGSMSNDLSREENSQSSPRWWFVRPHALPSKTMAVFWSSRASSWMKSEKYKKLDLSTSSKTKPWAMRCVANSGNKCWSQTHLDHLWPEASMKNRAPLKQVWKAKGDFIHPLLLCLCEVITEQLQHLDEAPVEKTN